MSARPPFCVVFRNGTGSISAPPNSTQPPISGALALRDAELSQSAAAPPHGRRAQRVPLGLNQHHPPPMVIPGAAAEVPGGQSCCCR